MLIRWQDVSSHIVQMADLSTYLLHIQTQTGLMILEGPGGKMMDTLWEYFQRKQDL